LWAQNDKEKYTILYLCGLEEDDGIEGSGTAWVLTAPWALGHCRDDNIAGSGRTTMLRAQRRRASMASWAREQRRGHIVVGSGRTTLLWAPERCRGLEDGAYMVDDVFGSGRGRWRHIEGLDRGWETRHGGSAESSTMARRLQGGLDNGTSSGEVDDDTGSMEIFAAKFWQPDCVSESIRGLWFAKIAQRFIYWRITIAMSTSDVSIFVAT
jgi:hypothetical protein